MTPIMDIDVSAPRVQRRDTSGRREVDEFGLKVQRMASVFSVTLVFVRIVSTQVFACDILLTFPVRSRDGCAVKDLLCRLQGRRETGQHGHVPPRAGACG